MTPTTTPATTDPLLDFARRMPDVYVDLHGIDYYAIVLLSGRILRNVFSRAVEPGSGIYVWELARLSPLAIGRVGDSFITLRDKFAPARLAKRLSTSQADWRITEYVNHFAYGTNIHR